MIISSTSNPRVRRARALKRRSDREREGAFLIESPVTLDAALASGLTIRETFVDRDRGDLVEYLDDAGLEPTLVADHVLRALADTTTPQGVVAVAALPRARLRDIPAEASLLVVLAEVRDPGNAGTLVRSAAGAGADAVVFTEASVDPFSPKTVRSSAGAVFRQPVVRAVSFDDTLQTLRDRGMQVFIAEAGEGPPAYEVDLTQPVAFVLGNEAHGVPQAFPDSAAISIPMPGGIESLNVAIAGSILLYETVRQRVAAAG